VIWALIGDGVVAGVRAGVTILVCKTIKYAGGDE